jgi:hypothetical protein
LLEAFSIERIYEIAVRSSSFVTISFAIREHQKICPELSSLLCIVHQTTSETGIALLTRYITVVTRLQNMDSAVVAA